MRQKQRKNELSAKQRALKLLTRREHSARELKRKLLDRGVDENEADAAVTELTDAGWQSDQRYAEMIVRVRIAQGRGPIRIRFELEQAGISAHLIANAMNEVKIDWNTQACEVFRQRFGFYESTKSDAQIYQKQYQFLMNRGFSGEHIHFALKNGPKE